MKTNRKWIESAAVAALVAALSITAVFTNDTTKVKNVEETVNVSPDDYATAGVTSILYNYELDAVQRLDVPLTIQKEEVEVVTASLEESKADLEEVAEVELSEEEQQWQNYLMPNVEKALNVRTEASEEAELAGKLHKGDLATIVEKGDGWTKITSGNVEGYVKNDYCLFGSDAYAYAKENCETIATVLTNGLRIRSEQSTEGEVIKSLAEGDELVVDTDTDTLDGWVAVKYRSNVYFVSADYVTVSLKTGTGMTMEEEAAKIAAEAAEKAKAEAASKQKASSGTVQGTSLATSADDLTLLAALIQCEAGGQSYECQLGVGAVVVNRVKSGVYPNSIYDVIYQTSQFGPASSGRLESRLASGVSETAYAAAQAALSGSDNTNGSMYFKTTASGHEGTVIGALVFY